MASGELSMRYPGEVEEAIRSSGLSSDLQLAYGASVAAEPSRYRYLSQDEPRQGPEQPALGVTAVSLNQSGDVTFRTATFGIEKHDPLVAIVDSIGTDSILRIAGAADNRNGERSFTNSGPVLPSLYKKINENGQATLGGIIIREKAKDDDGRMLLENSRFVTERAYDSFEELIKNPVTKFLALAFRRERARRKQCAENGQDYNTALVQSMFILAVSDAKKRGDPVVVDRAFVPAAKAS